MPLSQYADDWCHNGHSCLVFRGSSPRRDLELEAKGNLFRKVSVQEGGLCPKKWRTTSSRRCTSWKKTGRSKHWSRSTLRTARWATSRSGGPSEATKACASSG